MNGFAFVVGLVQALAWPVTAIIAVILLRPAIRTAVSGPLKRLKAGPTGVELEMWEKIEREVKVAAQAEALPKESDGKPSSFEGSLLEELAPVAEVSPEAAIVEGYARLEKELRLKVASHGGKAEPAVGGRVLARLAREQGVINDVTANAIEGLSVMRNLAAHGQAPSDLNTQRALDYLALVDGTMYAVRQSKNGGHG